MNPIITALLSGAGVGIMTILYTWVRDSRAYRNGHWKKLGDKIDGIQENVQGIKERVIRIETWMDLRQDKRSSD